MQRLKAEDPRKGLGKDPRPALFQRGREHLVLGAWTAPFKIFIVPVR